MSEVNWGNYAEAYKALHGKLDEILAKLDYPTDPAVQDVIDRADRVLGRVYGSQGQQLKQRVSTYDLLVQLVHQGVEYQAGAPGVGLATQKKIDLTATGIIHTPSSGKKIRLKSFLWSSNADIVTALRFGTGGDLLFTIQAKGVVGMNLTGAYLDGGVDEPLYGYLSGTGAMRGTVLIEEI